MATKNLKYFMRENTQETVTVPGPDSFRDENGNVIDFEIKVLSQAEIQKINDSYRRRTIATDKRGNPLAYNGEVLWKTERDTARAARHMVVEALVYPNLKDPELMKFYNCVDVTDMPLLVFPRSDEYQHVMKIITSALGLGGTEGDEETLEEAKN